MIFNYQWRSESAWRERAEGYGIVGTELPRIETDSDCENESSRKNRCVCGHLRRDHCTGDAIQHWPADAGDCGFYFCITTHCTCRVMEAGVSLPCPCTFFRTTPDARVKLKRPSPTEFTPCARCGHEKGLHCQGSPRRKLKPFGYQGFSIQGTPFPCSHTSVEKRYMCTSTACAEVLRDDGDGFGEFCDCSKYENPLLKSAPEKKSTSSKLRVPRKKKDAQATC